MISLSRAITLMIIVAILQGCATAAVTGVAAGAAVAYDRRTAGSVIDDQGIEIKAAYAIFNNKSIYDHSHVNITSYNGIVLLTGEAVSEEVKQKVTNVVKHLPKVRRIHNELAIAAPSALPSRSNDVWLDSKINTKLLGNKNTNAYHVKVVVERGYVYLMGLVTHSEGEHAVSVAKNTGGVLRVVKLFEYTD
jgi:osmotically-inducible protein OsmY